VNPSSNGRLIDIEDISKTYRLGEVDVEALRDVSLTIGRGEVVAIMGPSGSGKSTLMSILGCLDRPSSGRYHLDSVAVDELDQNGLAAVRNRKIGFVFQTFNLLPRAVAWRNVELPLLYAGVPGDHRARAVQALEDVGLGGRMHHHPAEMSGGERQRVAIARALINDPAIILADEPTGNLDSKTGADILKLLLDLNKGRGVTLVIVTHDASIAAQAGRILHLKDGQIDGSEA